MGTLLRYPYEVRDEKEYFDGIQDVKVTKDMLDLAKHIVEQKSGEFEPGKFEDRYEAALTELINQKRNGKSVAPKARPQGENVVDLMDALKTQHFGRRQSSARAESQEAAQGCQRPEGNAAADFRQGRRSRGRARQESRPERSECAEQDARQDRCSAEKAG